VGQHFNADVILLADRPSDRSGLASKAPASWRYINRGMAVRREVIGRSSVSLGLYSHRFLKEHCGFL
jgi:hypothetical protein